ncbi:hypothetical protein AB205_0128790 [Aquarana catesbeiana]|uniref:Uncharacterized protein n=1 Tax=Aquarana catesbeiana TaxID=8400 RepID=A0A2G9QAP0_AQUCT|nr:hypothetical protein AB205_0128790 [Aquarana catesbeiana]
MLYYDRLHFLAGQTEPRPSLSSLPSMLPSPPAEASDAQPGPSRPNVEEPRLSQGSLSQEVAGPSRLADLQVPPLPLERESGRRRSALICCFPDLCDFGTRLPSLTYGLLRPPILMFKN